MVKGKSRTNTRSYKILSIVNRRRLRIFAKLKRQLACEFGCFSGRVRRIDIVP